MNHLQNWQAKKAARWTLAQALHATHKHLVPMESIDVCGLTTAAKNIRKELAQAFPGVTFSVRTSRYSGGDSIDYTWTDGPNTEQVRAIADKYAGGDFDGMTDSYTHHDDAWTDAFGSAKYVHGQRSYSDATVAQVLAAVCAELGGIVGPAPTVEDYRQGRLWNVKQSGGCSVDREVNTALAAFTTFPAKVES